MKQNDFGIVIQIVVAAAVVVGIVAVIVYDGGGDESTVAEDFKYDVSQLREIDESLIIYKQDVLVIETGFETSRAIAVDGNGAIYIAGDTAYRIFGGSEDGKMVYVGGEPGCIAVEGGRVYLGFKDHVKVCDLENGKLDRWGAVGEDAMLTSLAVDGENVFAADAVNKVVYRYEETGKLLGVVGEKDAERNIDGFVVPSPYFDIAVGGDGLLRVVNPGRHRIEAYTFDGDLEYSWGKFSNSEIEGFCGCCNPVNIAMFDNGDFVTVEKGLVRVKLYDNEGKFKGVVAGPEQLGSDEGIYDMAVDKEGKVYVLDTVNNIIKVFLRK